MKITFKIRVEVLELFLFSSKSRDEISSETNVSINTISDIVNKYHSNGDCVVMESKLNKIPSLEGIQKRFPYADVISKQDIMQEFKCTLDVYHKIKNELIEKGIAKKTKWGIKFINPIN